MRAIRVVLALSGLVAIGYAIGGTITDPGTRLMGQLVFLAIVLIGHDAVVLPIALGVGAIVARWAPDRVRGPLYSGLFASAIVTLIALPFLVGAGRSADNPSALPLPYGRGLLIVLAVIWSGVAVAVVRRHVGSRALSGLRTETPAPGTADDR